MAGGERRRRRLRRAVQEMPAAAELLRHYEVGPVTFVGDAVASFQRHLVFDHAVDPAKATPRQQFEAVARGVRDVLTQRWMKTLATHDRENPKQVYYLSMEFLLGRSLRNNIANLGLQDHVRQAAEREGVDLERIVEAEPDAGLGNGGLGRLAACFIDSLATLEIPAMGYGLRYEYGIFRQDIRDGHQVERPDPWLSRPDPWELARPEETTEVHVAASVRLEDGEARRISRQPTVLLGVPYDRPVVGWGGRTINTLRLWGAGTPDFFDFDEFSSGDFFSAVHRKVLAENLTRVLYPDDSTEQGRVLRLVQEYFLVACSLADIVARFRRRGNDWRSLPDKVAVQLNDTHPAFAVAELMRILLDQAGLGWDDAWDLTTRTLAYTNHTLLPEALEKWPVPLVQLILPRHLRILNEVNRRFLEEVSRRFPGDHERLRRVSLFEEGPVKHLRMANVAILGTHSTNGVAAIHTGLLRSRLVPDFVELFPGRFSNKTNGVTPRRFLLAANPALAGLITETIGDGWITDLAQLRRLEPLAEDPEIRRRFRQAKREAKSRFSDWLRAAGAGAVDPDSIFDSQVKRIHEYKRQLLNLLHIVILYDRLRRDPGLDVPPRTFFFAGKAAPAYGFAKLVIKLIHNVAATIDAEPVAAGRLKVLFLPNYDVSLSERLIPASDVSEQISTAGYEASGTSNMKFMMNGALTVGTRDGATIEMAAEAGEENFFLFGLSADEVIASRGWYSPWWHYENEPETRRALDLIFTDHFSPRERGIFSPIRDTLLTRGDYFMHLADLGAYARAQEAVGALYVHPEDWTRRAIANVACSGKFSSDRSVREYAAEIWKVKPCPIE